MPPLSIPLPEGCERENEFADSTACNLGLTCDEQYVSVSCAGLGSGVYECGCQGRSSEKYSVEAESSSSACAASMVVCVKGDAAFEDDTQGCSEMETKSENHCESVVTCSGEVRLLESAVAVHVVHSVSCRGDQLEGPYCDCRDDGILDERFWNVDLEEGCGFAQAYCRSKKHEPVGTATCVPESSSTSPGSCQRQFACGQPMELDDGSTVSRYSSLTADCADLSEGGVSCSCYDDVGTGFLFDIEGVEATNDTCIAAGDVCAHQEELELADAVDCQIANQSTSGDQCNAGLECMQHGSIGELTVDIRGSIRVACSQGDGSLWGCVCSAGHNEATLDVEAEDGWAACEAAIEACPGSVELDPAGEL